MADDGVDPSKSMDDDDDEVDWDNSMDDDAVDIRRSMDADFLKVTGARKFSYDDLVSATNNFSKKERLGKGGFGAVYRGFMKELNCHVAVKRVSRDSRQGIKEYASEVKILTQLRHRNIVQLKGWCHEKKQLLLVYEFMANGSLDSHLFKEKNLLTWEVRYKIARGLASGLLYLHEEWDQYVVHRDMKASNVMLDSNFNAKLGDFGLARLGNHGEILDNTALAGTIGYVAPEYATTGRASKESDVYSFGVVALEIGCGRKVIDHKATKEDQKNLREWVWDLYGEGRPLEAADPRLNGEFDKQQMECLMIVGLWCSHPDAKLRPTIEEAIHVLNFVAPPPYLPSKMPFFSFFGSFSTSSSVTNFMGIQKQSPSVGYGVLVQTKQETLATGGSGALYKGFLRELFFSSRRSKGKEKVNDFEIDSGIRKFSYQDLVRATSNFSEHMQVKYGVYRGFLKELNSDVAVQWVRMGHNHLEKYVSEVNIISRVRHKNIVQLLGLCYVESKLFLVYEFMANGSLDSHLFNDYRVLKWDVRYRIAQEMASGLLHMHEQWEQCLLHRNVSWNSIMLDSDFNVKLGDFSLVRLMDHCTVDYNAPKFFSAWKSSRGYDVHRFGIVVLEIACGRKGFNLHGSWIDQWVWGMYKKGKLLEAVDPRLNGDFDEQEVKCLMLVGLWCTHPKLKSRPSIRQAYQVLNFEAPSPLLAPHEPKNLA